MFRSAPFTKVVVPLSATGLLFLGVAAPAAGAAEPASGVDAVAPTASKANKVRGKVKNGKRRTIVALNSSGEVSSRRKLNRSGKFEFRVRDGSSLHLIGKDGVYAGPLVLATTKGGKRAHIYFDSVDRDLNLGKVTPKNGFAKVGNEPRRFVDTSPGASAVARRGRPVGAGYQGVVRVKKKNLLSRTAIAMKATDLDRDGYVNVFDLDSNGNRVLNNVDPKRNRRGRIKPPPVLTGAASFSALAEEPPPGEGPPGGGLMVFSNYKATSPNLTDVINANLFPPGMSSSAMLAAIDASLVEKTGLAVQSISGADYKCTMPYCPSGTWTAPAGSTGDFQWNIGQGSVAGGIPAYPGLTHSDIGGGDTFIATAPDGTMTPGVMNFTFVTTPGLKSYKTFNAAGTVVETGAIDYTALPIKGSTADPIDVPAGGTVQLNWYVPQRLANSGETGFGPDGIFVNQGMLNYFADLPNRPTGVAGSGSGGNCATFKDVSSGSDMSGEYVNDSTGDSASYGRVFAFRMSIDECVDDFWSGEGTSWTTADFDIKAQSPNGGDNGAQKLYFARS